MKRIAKISFIIMIIFITLMSFSSVYAADKQIVLNVIQKSSETKYLENDQGYISKSIVDSNAKTGEVTIELKLSNTKKDTETSTNSETEIFFVIDESGSMDNVTETGEVRKNLVLNSAKKLASSIFEQSNSSKIGVVKFSVDGYFSTKDAKLIQTLSSDKQAVLNAIDKDKNFKYTGTNIDAGLKLAYNNFSENCKNKIMILLTDGEPTCDANGNTAPSNYSSSTYQKIITNTKETIQTISNSGIYLISMMTGQDPEDEDYSEVSKVITNIFGTSDNPTAGKFYNISDTDLESVVTNDILTDVMEIVQNPINTTKIVDYFPEDIMQNFEFSYVGNPSVGTASDNIDTENHTIEWDIGTLKGDEVATLRYKLKIKDMNNQELLGKTIATNEKVVLTYKDINDIDYTVTLASSPKIQLSEVAEEQNNQSKTDNTNTPKEEDNTTATGKLPQTGLYSGIIIVTILVVGIGIFTYKKYRNLRDI